MNRCARERSARSCAIGYTNEQADTQRRYHRSICIDVCCIPLWGPFIIVRRRLTSDRLDRSGYYSTIVHTYSDLSRGSARASTRTGNVPTRRVKIVSLEIARVPATKVTQHDYMNRRDLSGVPDRDRHLTNPSIHRTFIEHAATTDVLPSLGH